MATVANLNSGDIAKKTFTDLPAELRRAIYDHLLHADCVLEVYIPTLSTGKPYQPPKLRANSRQKISTSILRVNKTIYNEAIPILYSSNSFRMQSASSLTNFANVIGTSAQHLRHVGFEGHDFKKGLKALL
ncbi:hypothetical protein M409DRAFT_55066 [Zasmidium cellare ATCC 36951]|uniref:DUF7730 domain-containing protein n=1 Tax=Zasmidium cellare ATCC 36951 TaxID=1080233 RepID=A0A6A6CKG3_ZASCE|nr:uncharacterized protein M409DRAFT_55066 [Zasmidium cellare ATCC 36951]KAF2166199.1 hypothetical protein M409DRAFT_55066 [Zasmidium cellare ATCC 36951]